jgi:transposase InsO family protein
VKILNILDDHSRLLVASVALQVVDGAATLDAFVEAVAIIGWPSRFQSDNAPMFKFVLAEALAEIGVGAAHSRPFHPQTNGKVERFHDTLKRRLRRQAPSRIYTGIVNNGCIRLSVRWRISIGATHNNKRALAVVTGTNRHVFVEGRPARALTLNPNRVDQPLNRPTTGPTTVSEAPRHP